MKKSVLSYGEIIWDLYPDCATIGGAALNFAAHLAACGIESSLYSAVGSDSYGRDAKRLLSDFGVNADFVFESDKPTGACRVTLDETRSPSFCVLDDVAYDHIPLSEQTLSEIRSRRFDAIYFGTLSQRSPVSRNSLHRLCRSASFSEWICDVNLRQGCFDRDSVHFCLSRATVLKVSLEEEETLRSFGLYSVKTQAPTPSEIALAICGAFPNVRYLLLTMAENGALIYSAKEHKLYRQSADPVKAVSAVGAGDSFLAAWVSSYLLGAPIEECNRLAASLSSYVVSCTQAVPPYRLEGGVIRTK